MNFEKALSILRLTRDFTEEDLKKSYRRLAKKYHPDKFTDDKEKEEATKKMAEINSAKNYLDKHLEDRKTGNWRTSSSTYSTNNNGYRTDEYEKLKKEKDAFYKELVKEINEIKSILNNNDELLTEVKEKLIREFNIFIKMLNSVITISDLSNLKAQLNICIMIILGDYSIEYCKKYDIKINQTKLESYSLKILQKELEELRNRQENIIRRIEEEYSKYKYYAGFDVIEIILLKIKKETILVFKNENINNKNNNIDIEKIISRFNIKILMAFKDYYNRLEKLNELKEKYKNTTDSRIIELLTNLESSLGDPELFEKISKQLNYRISLQAPTNRSINRTPFNIREKLNERKEDYIRYADFNFKEFEKIINEKEFNNNKIYKEPSKIKKKIFNL